MGTTTMEFTITVQDSHLVTNTSDAELQILRQRVRDLEHQLSKLTAPDSSGWLLGLANALGGNRGVLGRCDHQ